MASAEMKSRCNFDTGAIRQIAPQLKSPLERRPRRGNRTICIRDIRDGLARLVDTTLRAKTRGSTQFKSLLKSDLRLPKPQISGCRERRNRYIGKRRWITGRYEGFI